jgi:hypothetical protein
MTRDVTERPGRSRVARPYGEPSGRHVRIRLAGVDVIDRRDRRRVRRPWLLIPGERV